MERLFFISGLPRSGSTLLANILAQNPDIHSSPTSGLLEILYLVRNQWFEYPENKALPDRLSKTKLRNVLLGIVRSFYADTDRPIVIDKSRGWLAHLELAELILQQKIKIIVPIRDIADILASLENIWRSRNQHYPDMQDKSKYLQFQTLEGRCEHWISLEGVLGIAYQRLLDVLQRGYSDRLFFVQYEALINAPTQVINSIYAFLEVAPYKHDYDYVVQYTEENDRAYGFDELHTIRPKIEPNESKAAFILGQELADKYNSLNFWKN